MGKYEDFLKRVEAAKNGTSNNAVPSSSSSPEQSKTSSVYDEFLNRVENAKSRGYNERFKFGENTYIYDKETGKSTRSMAAFKTPWSQSVKDAKKREETGHDTLGTDLGEMIGGTIERQGANYLNAGATIGLLAGGILHGDNKYQPEKGSGLWKLLQASSADTRVANEYLSGAKEGRGWVGSTLMDVGSSAIDVAIDQTLNLIVPGASMTAMSVRGFGGASQEARDQGKSISTQVVTGLKSAAIEYLTEKMWGIGGRKGKEGTGYIERLTKRWENNLIEKGVPAVIEKMAAAFGSEAVEEMMSDILNPIVDKGISSVSKKFGGDYEESGFPKLTEILHDGLVGGLVGLGGGTSEGVKIQRDINSSGGVGSWITAERQQDQMNAEQAALDMVKDRITTKDGKAKIGPLFKAKVANYFATERGTKVGNEMADMFFEAYDEVKAEEFKDPAKALAKIIEKYEEKAIARDLKSNAVAEEAEPDSARYFNPELSEEENAAITEQLKQGEEPIAPEAEQAYTESEPFTVGGEENGNQGISGDNEGRTQSDVQLRGERPENTTVSSDNEGALGSEQGRNGAQNQRVDTEAQEVSPHDRVDTAVRKTIEKRFGALTNGEVNQQKASSRLDYAKKTLKSANINDDVANKLIKHFSDDYRYGYEMAAQGNIEAQIAGEALDSYYDGLSSAQMLGAIAEGDSPSLVNIFREAGMTDAQAKFALNNVRKALQADGFFTEANVNASKRNGAFNPNAQRSQTRVDYSGKEKSTANVTEYNADFGEAETITFGKKEYVPKTSDKVIGRVTVSKQTGNLKSTSLNYNRYYDVIMRGQDNYLVVDDTGKIMGTFDEEEKAYAAAKGTSSTYSEARVKLASGLFADYSDGKWLTLDLNKVYSQEAYNKSLEEGDRNSAIRYITRNRSHASDLMGVKYSTYKDAKTTTESLTIDLRGSNQDDIANILKKVIDLSASGEGIRATNGKHYVFAGQTASQRKNGVIQLMEKSAYEKVRDRMTGFLSVEEIDKANPAKYLANLGFMFTPSNDDTDVKIKDCVILPDYHTQRYNVTNDFMVTDMKNDRASLEKDYGKEKADEIMNGARVGFMKSVLFDVLDSNSTDGFGFVWSDKGTSFQMRSIGGIKGLLQGFDFYSYLKDNLPYRPEVTKNNFDYFMKDENGKIWARDRWGIPVPLEGKKALLFESTVKFADSYGEGEEGHNKFYKLAGEEDIRSVPRENVYGSNANAGMVYEMKRRGLTQFLRKEYGFSDADINEIADYYLLDIEDKIMNNPQLLAKMFAADFGSIKSDSNSFQSVMVSLLGEKFFGTPLGQEWAVNKLSQIANDFKAGKLYMTQDESTFGWIAPDTIGLFNKMANIYYKGYGGLAEGQINNQRLKKGATVVGRNPSAETNDVQVRKNELNQAYADLTAEYGLDPEVTLLALSDNLGLHLDNDYDGDTSTLYQGFLAKSLDAIRTKASEQGRDYTKATIFTHTDPNATNQKITTDSLIGVVKLGMDAESVGIFDNAIDILNAFSDKELENAVKKFNKDNNTNYNVQSFRDLMMARFATAYKFNFDYAKQGYYPVDFKKVVNESLEMLDDILYENGYAVNWADSEGQLTTGDSAMYKEGRRKKVWDSAYAVPETWQYSNNPNKREAYQKAYAEEQKTGKKYIMREGGNVLAKMNKAVDLKSHKKQLQSKFGKANQNGEKFRFSRLSTYSPDRVSSFGQTAPEAVGAAQEAMAAANEFYQDKTVSREENSRRAQELLYNFQKSLGFNNEQFTSFMLYALEADTDSTGIETLFNLNQNRFDKNNTDPSTAEILVRNAKMMLTNKTYNEAVLHSQAISDSINELQEMLKDAKPATPEQEADYGRFAALRNVLNNANAEIQSLKTQLDDASEELKTAKNPEDIRTLARICRDLLSQGQAIFNDPDNQLAHKEYKALKEKLGDLVSSLEAELETLPELEAALAENQRFLEKNRDLYESMLTRAWYYGYEDIAPSDNNDDFSEFSTAYHNSNFYQRSQAGDIVGQIPIEDFIKPPQATATEQQVPAQETTDSKKDNWKRAVANFGPSHKFVSSAVSTFSKITDARAKGIRQAYANLNNGVTTDLSEVITEFGKLKGTEYYSEELANDLEKAQKLFTDTLTEKSSQALKANVVANTARMISNNIAKQERVNDTLKRANDEMKGHASNYDDRGGIGKAVGKLTRYTLTSPTMFKAMFGYDSNSLGYEIANEIEASTKKYMALMSRGNSFYNDIINNDSYKNFYEGKTKLSELVSDKSSADFAKIVDAFGNEAQNLSANDAMYILAAYEQMKTFKSTGSRNSITPYYNPFWVKGLTLENGKTITFDYKKNGERGIRDGYEALKSVVESNEMLKSYREATAKLFETYSGFANDVAKRVYGFQNRNYGSMPLSWLSYDEDGNVIEPERHNEWDAEEYIKDPAINLPYNKDSANYLKVVPITRAVDTYVRKMSDFIANKEFRDYMTALNTKRANGKNLADIVGANWGTDYAKWVNNFVDDITLNRENNSFFKDLRIAMQKGALIGNPSTIIKQSSSYWSAAGMLSMNALLKARTKRIASRHAGDDTDIVRFRKFTNAMAPEIAEILENNNKPIDKFLNKLPGFNLMRTGIAKMDALTVNNLFTATVYDCLENYPNLDPASEQFREKVLSKFEDVVIYTQPMFNKMLRAEYGRTNNEAVRMLSMFRTQQTQNFNRLATTIGEYQFAKNNGLDTAETKETLRETIKGQAMAALSIGLLSVLADLATHKWKKYRDDDGEIDVGKVFGRAGLNSLEAASGTVWFGDEVSKLLIDVLSRGGTSESQYGISMGAVSTIESASDAITSFAKDPSLSSARYAAGYIAQLFGIPLNNAYKYLNTASMWAAEMAGANPKDYDDIIQLAEKNNKIDKNLKPAQKALKELGYSKKEANNLLLAIDENFNGKLSQEEIEAMYYEHPESAGVLQALWDMQGWSKKFGQMTKTADKKRTFASNPLYEEMDEDDSESVSKTELMNYYIDHPEIRDELEQMYTELGFKDFASAVKSADKKIKFRSNPLYAEMDEDENESVSKTELVNYAIEHPEMYDTLAPLYKELGFKGTFRSAIRSGETTKLKETAEDAFYDNDYNALFDSVSQMKNGKTWLTNMVEDEYPEYENVQNPLLRYLTESGLSNKQVDSAVESLGAQKIVPQYKKLREAGLTPKQAVEKLDVFDANDNGSITQAELADYYKAHPEDEALVAEFWSACGWSKSWAQYKKSKKIK